MLKKLIDTVAAKVAKLRNRERVVDPETGNFVARGESPLAVPVPKPEEPTKPYPHAGD